MSQLTPCGNDDCTGCDLCREIAAVGSYQIPAPASPPSSSSERTGTTLEDGASVLLGPPTSENKRWTGAEILAWLEANPLPAQAQADLSEFLKERAHTFVSQRPRHHFDVLAELAVLWRLEYDARESYYDGLYKMLEDSAMAINCARQLSLGAAVQAYVVSAAIVPAPHRDGGMGCNPCPACGVKAVVGDLCGACEWTPVPKERASDRFDHCDPYIHDPQAPRALRWYLFVNRLPARDKWFLEERVGDPVLFAKHNGEWVRVVMASRFGDVGITDDLDSGRGYNLGRVGISDLAEFTDQDPREPHAAGDAFSSQPLRQRITELEQNAAIYKEYERVSESALSTILLALAPLRNEIVEAAETDTEWEAVAVAAGWIKDEREATLQSAVALYAAFDILRDHTAKDPDPVSIITEGDERKHEISIVAIRGQAVIEMFRQWAERNGIYKRGHDLEGNPREKGTPP